MPVLDPPRQVATDLLDLTAVSTLPLRVASAGVIGPPPAGRTAG